MILVYCLFRFKTNKYVQFVLVVYVQFVLVVMEPQHLLGAVAHLGLAIHVHCSQL